MAAAILVGIVVIVLAFAWGGGNGVAHRQATAPDMGRFASPRRVMVHQDRLKVAATASCASVRQRRVT
jgi:hypothetical protein